MGVAPGSINYLFCLYICLNTIYNFSLLMNQSRQVLEYLVYMNPITLQLPHLVISFTFLLQLSLLLSRLLLLLHGQQARLLHRWWLNFD